MNSNTGALKWEYKAGSVTDWLLRGCTVQNNFVYVPYTAGQNTKDSAPKTDILDANTGKKIRTLDGKVEINPSVLDDIVFLSRSNSNKCQGVSAYTTSTGNKVWENCALPIAIGALTNLSPNELIRNHRLRRALPLLKRGDSIADVAFQVGFENPSYFSKCFKEVFGQRPSDVSEL